MARDQSAIPGLTTSTGRLFREGPFDVRRATRGIGGSIGYLTHTETQWCFFCRQK